MDRGMFLRVTAPAVMLGLLLLATCMSGVHYIQRLQTDLAGILSQNVASLQAARELELSVRQLRFHDLLYLMDPSPDRLQLIEEDRQEFRRALEVARTASRTPEEQDAVRAIEDGYRRYQDEQARTLAAARGELRREEFARLIDSHPVRRFIVEPCQELLRLNKEQIEQTAAENQRVGQQTRQAMVLLGLAGPIGGLALGYGVARGLSRSIYRLSVRVQDMAHQLDTDVASVSIAAHGDLRVLDRQLQHIVGKVEEAAARLQQQQRELLRAEQLSAVGQLAAGVAHEVRNPLTGIKLLVEAALRPVRPTPLNAEDLRVIHDEIVRLETTVQSFLDFARLPAPQRQLCDLRDIVRRAGDLVRARAVQQNVEVGMVVPDEPVIADVDSAQMTTVLVNLLLNALDAMPRGGRLDVELADTFGEIHLAVADTGPGIAPDIVDRLFTPFATTKPTGTGLGLSLSRRIVDEHGGKISGGNRPGGGARFLIAFPPQAAEVNCVEAVGDRR
jgi:two-component system, NtrC family, sensor histidine kinase HydH